MRHLELTREIRALLLMLHCTHGLSLYGRSPKNRAAIFGVQTLLRGTVSRCTHKATCKLNVPVPCATTKEKHVPARCSSVTRVVVTEPPTRLRRTKTCSKYDFHSCGSLRCTAINPWIKTNHGQHDDQDNNSQYSLQKIIHSSQQFCRRSEKV